MWGILPPLRVKRLPHGEGLPLPSRATPGSVGFDLAAACDVLVTPGSQAKIETGFAVAIPAGYVGFVPSRSGLAAKHQVAVTNSPGVIDPDYRGEVFILLENRGHEPFTVRRGDRLAQLVVVPAPPFVVMEAEDLEDTARGANGFGSTGR